MSELNPETIRDAKLPVGRRGFDQAATREHLDRVAAAHATLLTEVTQLRSAVETLEARQSSAPSDEEQVAKMTDMLLAAKRTSDQLLRDAEEKATALLVATEAERSQILGKAAAESADRVAGLDAEVHELIRERDHVRATIAKERAAFTETLERALRELEGPPSGEDSDLSSALRSRLAGDIRRASDA
jgi:cell division septum initiation protein DivIVA